MADKNFQELLAELNEFDERERAAARDDYAATVKAAGKASPALTKSLRALDEAATKICREANARAKAQEEAQAAARPVLGLMLRAAVNDAVLAGRLSGTSAVAGLRALGLED